MGRGADAPDVKLSKKLSRVLRHGVHESGLGPLLCPDGFVPLDALLASPGFGGVAEADVRRVVDGNDKQRFALRVDEASGALLIRANQGHSIVLGLDDDALLEPLPAPPDGPLVAVHGTNRAALAAIAASGGLSRMARRHVHLAAGLPGRQDVVSGMRASADVHIWVDLASARAGGVALLRSANGVVLTAGLAAAGSGAEAALDGVLPLEHFARVVDARTGEPIPGPWDAHRAARGEAAAAAADAAEAAAAEAGDSGGPGAGPASTDAAGGRGAGRRVRGRAQPPPLPAGSPPPFASEYTSALALLPPPCAWPPIQAIRKGARAARAHVEASPVRKGAAAAASAAAAADPCEGARAPAPRDKAFARWPPHVNVLYPFVPRGEFARAAAALVEALEAQAGVEGCGAGSRAFELELAGVEHFQHGAGRPATVWLRPDRPAADSDGGGPSAPLRALAAAAARAVPFGGRGGGQTRQFVPHLTVGQWAGGAELDDALRTLRAGWEPLRWRVDSLALLSRAGPDEPFAVHARVLLADGVGGRCRWELVEPPEPYLPHGSATAGPA